MNLKLLFQMIFGVFSLKRNNMRWFNFRRVFVCIFLLPFFLLVLVVNNFFLLLDYIFFPAFLRQKIKKPIFIISAPRSATTYLFHTLAKNERYTCMRLWEIVFAPSICQKYLALAFNRIDKLFGNPLKKLMIFIEGKLFRKLKKIHPIGLNQPEEDEAILLWSLSSLYFNFFFPDSNFFDDLVLFDDKLNQKRKARIMKFYSRFIQRHNYVFNRKQQKQYLSKNPLMMSKVASLATIYPDALILNINRCPAKTIPSTLELNRNLYGLFTSRPVPKELNDKTFDILIEWYKMAEKNINLYFAQHHLKIDFTKLTQQDPQEIQRLEQFLELPKNLFTANEKSMNKKHKSKNRYTALSDKKLDKVLDRIPFMKNYC